VTRVCWGVGVVAVSLGGRVGRRLFGVFERVWICCLYRLRRRSNRGSVGGPGRWGWGRFFLFFSGGANRCKCFSVKYLPPPSPINKTRNSFWAFGWRFFP